jgi:hypothetical protein
MEPLCGDDKIQFALANERKKMRSYYNPFLFIFLKPEPKIKYYVFIHKNSKVMLQVAK